ncbi:hypothetical protein [Streptomyces sp. NPDC088183]|uniref:hypothetical protein n=1 Tax=Streptomyces sp. NPDC088183 TaxID=3160992 RepID=UPI003420E91A
MSDHGSGSDAPPPPPPPPPPKDQGAGGAKDGADDPYEDAAGDENETLAPDAPKSLPPGDEDAQDQSGLKDGADDPYDDPHQSPAQETSEAPVDGAEDNDGAKDNDEAAAPAPDATEPRNEDTETDPSATDPPAEDEPSSADDDQPSHPPAEPDEPSSTKDDAQGATEKKPDTPADTDTQQGDTSTPPGDTDESRPSEAPDRIPAQRQDPDRSTRQESDTATASVEETAEAGGEGSHSTGTAKDADQVPQNPEPDPVETNAAVEDPATTGTKQETPHARDVPQPSHGAGDAGPDHSAEPLPESQVPDQPETPAHPEHSAESRPDHSQQPQREPGDLVGPVPGGTTDQLAEPAADTARDAADTDFDAGVEGLGKMAVATVEAAGVVGKAAASLAMEIGAAASEAHADIKPDGRVASSDNDAVRDEGGNPGEDTPGNDADTGEQSPKPDDSESEAAPSAEDARFDAPDESKDEAPAIATDGAGKPADDLPQAATPADAAAGEDQPEDVDEAAAATDPDGEQSAPAEEPEHGSPLRDTPAEVADSGGPATDTPSEPETESQKSPREEPVAEESPAEEEPVTGDEPESHPVAKVATEPEVTDLEGVHPSTDQAATSAAGAGRQDREAPDLPDPVDGPAQSDPTQVNDVQKAQAGLDAANAAAQETEESSDDTPNQDDLESDGATPARGTAPPLEADGDADEQSDTHFAPLDGLHTSPGNDNSTDQEDQASDRIQTDGASETGENEPPEPSLKGDGEEDSSEAAHTEEAKPAADKAIPGTQTREINEASSPHNGSLNEDENPPLPQETATDEGVDEGGKPTKEKSFQKELVPEHRIEPAGTMEASENGDISAPVVEKGTATSPTEPAKTTGAPDLPEPEFASRKPESHPATGVASEPEAANLEGLSSSTEEVALSSAGAGHPDREASNLPGPVDKPAKPDPDQVNDAGNSQVDVDATSGSTAEVKNASEEASDHDEPADPDEAPDPGEPEDVNELDAPSEEDDKDGEAGTPETGDQSENSLADLAEALGERHPEVASVITKLGADDANRLNVIENLKDPEGGGERTLAIIQELAEGETLGGRSLEEYRSENPGRGPLFEPVEHEVNYEPDGTSRKNAYVEQTKLDEPVRALGASIEDGDRDALDDYGMRLQNEVEPAVYEDVTSLLEKADDAELSIRTKSADGLVDKVNRMTEGSEGRKARPDYEIGDVIDAVGARITVEDTAQLEAVLEKSKGHFGTGEGGRLLEVENMYAEPKSGNPSYRVIPMVVAIEVDGKPYTYELQLTTERASVAADLEHNTVYKSHIETTPEERDVMRRMQAEAAALDQEETRRRYP